jgi:hypothetical protein
MPSNDVGIWCNWPSAWLTIRGIHDDVTISLLESPDLTLPSLFYYQQRQERPPYVDNALAFAFAFEEVNLQPLYQPWQ